MEIIIYKHRWIGIILWTDSFGSQNSRSKRRFRDCLNLLILQMKKITSKGSRVTSLVHCHSHITWEKYRCLTLRINLKLRNPHALLEFEPQLHCKSETDQESPLVWDSNIHQISDISLDPRSGMLLVLDGWRIINIVSTVKDNCGAISSMPLLKAGSLCFNKLVGGA